MYFSLGTLARPQSTSRRPGRSPEKSRSSSRGRRLHNRHAHFRNANLPRIAPKGDKVLEGLADAGDEGGIIDLSGEPGQAGFFKDSSADGEAPAGGGMGSLDKALGESLHRSAQPEEKHSAAVRVAFGDQLIGHPPLGRGH